MGALIFMLMMMIWSMMIRTMMLFSLADLSCYCWHNCDVWWVFAAAIMWSRRMQLSVMIVSTHDQVSIIPSISDDDLQHSLLLHNTLLRTSQSKYSKCMQLLNIEYIFSYKIVKLRLFKTLGFFGKFIIVLITIAISLISSINSRWLLT